MEYLPQHAERALEILRRSLPHVEQRPEYLALVSILQDPNRWKEAHDQFSRIRTNVTLPLERQKRADAEAYFAHVAENAAKTAYNCSGEPAPFDEDSFEWLLRCEDEFLASLKKEANQPVEATADPLSD